MYKNAFDLRLVWCWSMHLHWSAHCSGEKMEQTTLDMTVGADSAAKCVSTEHGAEVIPPPQDTQKMIHTRSCNRREVCSCFLRLQSAYFQKNLVAKRKKKKQQLLPRDDGDGKDEHDAPVDSIAVALKREASGNESNTATPSKKKRATIRRYRAVTNLQLFDIETKQLISMFLSPAELAKLSMVCTRVVGFGFWQSYANTATKTLLVFACCFVGE